MSVNDFNLAFCGLATAAVGLGYVCGRRLSGSSPLPTDLHAKKNTKDLEAGLPANEPSVGQKRKRMDHDFDEVKSDLGYPHNLKQIYPHKRMRTPTPPPDPALLPQHAPEPEASVEPAPQVLVEAHPVQQETAIIVDVQTSGEARAVSPVEQSSSHELVSAIASPPRTQVVAPQSSPSVVEPARAHSPLEVHANARESESTSSATASDPIQVKGAEVAALDENPAPQVDALASPKPGAVASSDEQTETTSEKTNAAAEQARPTDAASTSQAAEAGPSTPPSEPAVPAPFPKVSPAFELKAPSNRPKTPETPKPTSSRGRGFAAFAGSASPFAKLATPKAGSSTAPAWASPNAADSNGPPAWVDPTSSAWAERKTGSPVAKKAVALEPQVFTAPVAHSYSTGEEDEDATLEIRAIRLYTKRGSKGFSEGLVGTMKVLRHKETQKQRLLFRRDPLFQVAMNVRVQEGMRCIYDAKDRVVRIVTREPSSEGTPEIVIYAMKPSRSCPKTKFEEFGEALTTLVGSLSAA